MSFPFLSGAFSIVRVATHKQTGERFAIKVIDKRKLGNEKNRLAKEVEILETLDHENIIQLLEIYETDNHLYLVMELVTGGELFDRIVDKGSFSERDASVLIGSVISAVKYLHDRGIVHRDLKPENLLFSDDGYVSLSLSLCAHASRLSSPPLPLLTTPRVQRERRDQDGRFRPLDARPRRGSPLDGMRHARVRCARDH